jgi:hypothetical protein
MMCISARQTDHQELNEEALAARVLKSISPFVKDYPTPASNADVIRKPLLAGRHRIILNRSGTPRSEPAVSAVDPLRNLWSVKNQSDMVNYLSMRENRAND